AMSTTSPASAASAALSVPSGNDDAASAEESLDTRRFIAASALLTLGALCLGLLVCLVFVSQVIHARDQEVIYSDFRSALANALAPVGQTTIEGAPLAPGDPVAVLQIPVLGVQEVVLEGTTSTVTQSGPGHKRDTVLPGQAGTSVIYGRQASYGGPFGQISLLEPGSTINVVTGQGEHQYSVIGVRRAGDPVLPPLEAGQGRLTLVTGDGPRYMPNDILRVDAALVSPVQPAPARFVTAASLDPSELAMSGDPAALVPALLWAQLLLIAAVGTVWLLMRWGRWQAWLVAVPVLLFVGISLANDVLRLLPNLL
ncbi:MAG: class E sortase, partial [bacterium]